MNILLKILAAIALVAVTLAAGAVLLGRLSEPPAKIDQDRLRADDKHDKTDQPAPISDDKHEKNPDPSTPIEEKPKQLSGPIEVSKDDPLQPSYRPVNQPEYIQILRQEGKTYHNTVAGKLSGQASKKDWGIVGTAFFDYIYTVDSEGRIVKNDGVKIVEERTFGVANESLMVSAYELGIELPESLSLLCSLAQTWGKTAGSVHGATVEQLAAGVNAAQEKINHFRIPVSKSLLDSARAIGLFKPAPSVDPSNLERELKMFTQGPDTTLLQGKTVRIEFVDGYGVRNIEPINCSLSEQERDVIVRTNFIVDHYLFPDKKVAVDEEWTVDGSVFGGFLDPRLRGKVAGAIKVTRTPDFDNVQAARSKKLKVLDGNITVSGQKAGSEINGEVNSLRGVATIANETGIVTTAHFHGTAQYSKLSRDHLLFEARTSVSPRFEVQYECSVH